MLTGRLENNLLVHFKGCKEQIGTMADVKLVEEKGCLLYTSLPYKDDKEFCKKYEKVKRNNKIRFAKYIKEKQGIEVNPESIFDVHCKRLHEYKRQLLKCLHIIYIYQKIKKDPACITTPVSYTHLDVYKRQVHMMRSLLHCEHYMDLPWHIQERNYYLWVENSPNL